MNKTSVLIIGAIIVIVGASVVIAKNKSSNITIIKDEQKKDTIMEDESKTNEEKMMDQESIDSAMMEKNGSYKDYSEAVVTTEQASGNKVVLFFHANWCPFCKAADTAFKANLKEIPAGVTILKTDYDSQTALKTKYGVTTQHTFVQVDSQGNQIAKWVSGDTAELKTNLK